MLIFVSVDGCYINMLIGDGCSVIVNGLQVVWVFYDFYVISVGMCSELEQVGSDVKEFE